MQKPQKWPDCDEPIRNYIAQFVELMKQALDDRLIGVYLHGSLAMGSYYPPKSDMDLIAIVSQHMEAQTAEQLLFNIALFSELRPTLGNIEFSAITASAAQSIPNPMPYEIHYSSDWHDRILRHDVQYQDDQFDSDLFAHLMCLKKRGVCLYGQPIAEALGDVRWNDFMFAVLDDLDWILGDENITESPFYCILNICRAFQLLVTKQQNAFSKDEGALWGLTAFPEDYTGLIQKALDVYHSERPLQEAERRSGGVPWNHRELLAFRDYARALLKTVR